MTRTHQLAALLAAAALVAPTSYAAVTGFNQTGAGPYDYNDIANWVGGDINGVWDGSLTLTDTQTVQLDADTAVDGLVFEYAGSENLNLYADGSARTLTLNGDILHNTASASRAVYIDDTNGDVSVDLGGGMRTIDIRGGESGQRLIRFWDTSVSNGGLALQGSGYTQLYRTTFTLSDLTTRNIELSMGYNSVINVAGDWTVDGAATRDGNGFAGGITEVRFSHNGVITANSLQRTNSGVVQFAGSNLGAGGASDPSVTFTNSLAPQLIGGDGSNTTNVAILPWAIGGTSVDATDSFVTYGANGIRVLDKATEFHQNSLATANADDNVRIYATTETMAGNQTVNSLFLESDGTTMARIDGTGALTVASGAVYLDAIGGAGSQIDVDLNFGTQQGVIGFQRGKPTYINGAIAGSDGLVFYQAHASLATNSGGTGIALNSNAANSTYTGDTHILGRVLSRVDFLPSGTRSGDLYVDGLLAISGTTTINGLYGSGQFSEAFSGASNLYVGDNDSDGDFAGSIASYWHLHKIGAGTLVLSGENTYAKSSGTAYVSTTVEDGTLIVNGSLASSTNSVVVSGGTLGGSGLIAGQTTVQTGGTLAPGNSAGTLTIDNGLTLEGTAAFELDSASSYDRVLVNTITDGSVALTFGGDLVVTDNGVAFAAGQVFDLFDWGANTTVSGVFDSVILPTLADGLAWEDFGGSSFDYATGQIAVIPEPGSFVLMSLGVLAAAGGGKRRSR